MAAGEAASVIGETLRPATSDADLEDRDFLARLSDRVRAGQPPETYEETIADPPASWIERTLGIAFNEAEGRLLLLRAAAALWQGRRWSVAGGGDGAVGGGMPRVVTGGAAHR